ncbi:MAG: TRAM domain-containing protein [Firmicutes bacterium]|nr:TRAM domain-containing protein [Bacillota bacterium]
MVGFWLGGWLGEALRRGMARFASAVRQMSFPDLLSGVLGVLVGLGLGLLLSLPWPRPLPVVGEFLPVLLTMAGGYLGAVAAWCKKDEIAGLVGGRKPGRRVAVLPGQVKILDTSVIIDGRIADVASTGFLEGTLLVPAFVLKELQLIADSSDVLKRNRGRRGLDVLQRIQKESKVAVEILDPDEDDGTEVDLKLVRLAKRLGAKVLTNDFNLNKIAELKGVDVLNINELANAMKPVVLPGEEMVVHVIKDGKEHGQGVGYLDDGTMIVVDGGRRFIGESVGVMVTSVLQTAAGRMIFAKPKPLERAL